MLERLASIDYVALDKVVPPPPFPPTHKHMELALK